MSHEMSLDKNKPLDVARALHWLLKRTGKNAIFIIDINSFLSIEELKLVLYRLRLLCELGLIIPQKLTEEDLLYGELTQKGLKMKEMINV